MAGTRGDHLNGDDRESPEAAVYRWVAEAPRKMTASDLEKRLSRRLACPRNTARRMVRKMVGQGRLRYVYLYGQSYIDLSFQRPTPIGRQVLLVPPDCTPKPAAGQHAIFLTPGAAFGDGRHPTTRLALKGLASIWRSADNRPERHLRRGIDIGTGSGILAIAAARFGVDRMDALDLDPCALNEARLNVDHNGLASQIRLSRQPLENFDVRYDLILANLRLPTLCAIADWIDLHARPQSYLVFSGFREPELASLKRAYPGEVYTWCWWRTQAGWCGVVLQKNRPL